MSINLHEIILGGHCNAAGGKSEVSMEETVSKFEDLVTKLTI
jgi:phosphoesterase RecJ-like protein